MNTEKFASPENIFRGTDFWMLNDTLTEEGIQAQIHEMKDKGVYSFIARTYIGLKSDYPGRDFMQKMRVIISTAKECGLRVFVQAGYMPEAVLGLPEDYALRYIYPVKKGEENGRPVFCTYGDYSFTEENSKTFLDMFRSEAMDFYLKKSYEEMWEEFSAEYGKTVMSVWVDEPSYNASYLPWTKGLAEAFKNRYGYDLTKKLYLLYFDGEDCKTVRYHYREIMRDLLEQNYFRRVREWCNSKGLLFSGHLMMEETLTSQIRRAAATMPYYKYFDIPGIDVLCGRMNWVDSPLLPTSDTALDYNLYTTALQCTSAAHQAGKKHILAEMYGVTTENMTFRNQLNMFDSYAAMGINHRSVHGMFYSLRGRGKRAYPPHVNYYQPYWKKYKNVTDYCARVSAFISEGKPYADIAVIHPLETGYTLYKGPIDGSLGGSKEGAAYDMKLFRLIAALKSSHREAELCDLSTLSQMGSVNGKGELCVGEMSYKTVILPQLDVLTDKALSLISDFAAKGGRVIILESLPTMINGYASPDLGKRLLSLPNCTFAENLSGVDEILSEKPSDFTLCGDDVQNLLVNRRKCENGNGFFIFNRDCSRSIKAILMVKGLYKVTLFNSFDGSVADYEQTFLDGDTTSAHIEIPCGASLLLFFENVRASSLQAKREVIRTSVFTLPENWEVTPHGKNTLLLEYCRFRKGDGEPSDMLPIMAVHTLLTSQEYRGDITLSYDINAESNIGELYLAVESPECQSFFLDGKEVSAKPDGFFFAKEFERFTLAKELSKGKHTLEIKRFFSPLTKSTNSLTQLFETQLGAELEPVYLLGDFSVKSVPEASINGCSVCTGDFRIAEYDKKLSAYSELTTAGFPFYTGEISMEKSFILNAEEAAEKNPSVYIGTMNAAVGELYVNGKYAGDINRAPCEISCEGLLKIGENTLEIKLFNTLRNIIGPFHRPRGEVGNLFGGGYKNANEPWISVDISKIGWEKNMRDCYPSWTDSYNLAKLGVENVKIICRS